MLVVSVFCFIFLAGIQVFAEDFLLRSGPLLDGRFQGGEGAQIVGNALEFDPHPVFSGFGQTAGAVGGGFYCRLRRRSSADRSASGTEIFCQSSFALLAGE